MSTTARRATTPTNFHVVDDIETVQELSDAGRDAGAGMPSLLHFIWVGSQLPADAMLRLHSWASLNPGLSVCLWGEDALESLAASTSQGHVRDLVGAAANPAVISDVGRFAILHEVGGVYLDVDFEACRPIAPLLAHAEGFVVRESRWAIVAAAAGLPPNSVFARVALRVIRHAWNGSGAIDNFTTGPPLVTELTRTMRLLGTPAPAVLPEWTFFPDNPFRFPRRARSAMPPYGMHLYHHSWGEGTELRLARRVSRGLLQLATPRDFPIGSRRRVQLMLRRLAVIELASAMADRTA